MPKIADIEITPNLNARKFILQEPLSWGISHSYEDAFAARDDSLAREIFKIKHIVSVFYMDNWLTVSQDGTVSWDQLLREVAAVLRNAPAAALQSQVKITLANEQLQELSPADKERLSVIQELLDTQIRPYLQSDGGDLHILALLGNRLKIHYQGACGSCPSSLGGTLGSVINLIHSIAPELEIDVV